MNASGSDLQTAEGIAKAIDSFNSDKVPNSDVVASNAELVGKMDELIGLMRTSNGYQQKISMQTYA